MKKIILLLALALGVEVKGQIVGGFVPINSSKSFTAGNSTFSNVIARGTLSVGSTATVTDRIYLNGAVPFNTVFAGSIYKSSSNGLAFHGVTGSQNDFALFAPNGNGIFKNPTSTRNLHLCESGSVSIGSNTTPSAALHVFGNAKVSSTFSLGSANLTGGNTGTVAVLSDVYFTIPLGAGATSPIDATPYYFGNVTSLGMSGNKYFMVNIPYACTLIGYDFQVFSNGVIGSSESATLSLVVNNSSTVTLNSAVSYTNNNTPAAVNGFFSLQGTGFSTSLSASDYIFAQLNTPTWGTNPTSIVHSLILYFKRN